MNKWWVLCLVWRWVFHGVWSDHFSSSKFCGVWSDTTFPPHSSVVSEMTLLFLFTVPWCIKWHYVSSSQFHGVWSGPGAVPVVRGGGGCPDELSVAASSQSPHSRERGVGLQSQGLHTGRAQVSTRRLSPGVATCLSLLSCLEGCNCDGLALFMPGRMTVSVKSLSRMMDICAV